MCENSILIHSFIESIPSPKDKLLLVSDSPKDFLAEFNSFSVFSVTKNQVLDFFHLNGVFDCVWIDDSVIFLSDDELTTFLLKIHEHLRIQGVVFFSFTYGKKNRDVLTFTFEKMIQLLTDLKIYDVLKFELNRNRKTSRYEMIIVSKEAKSI